MGTVTISASYGSGGSMIGPAVAERLSLPYIDRAIPAALADELALPPDTAPGQGESRRLSRVFGGSMLRGLSSFAGVTSAVTPEDLEGADVCAYTEGVIRSVADSTGAVVLGRAGVFILGDRPDVLHVRLDGPVEARRRQAMELEGVDADTAAHLLDETDRARSFYVRQFYRRDWSDPRAYHLVIDSTAVPRDVCVELIATAARARFAAAPPTGGG